MNRQAARLAAIGSFFLISSGVFGQGGMQPGAVQDAPKVLGLQECIDIGLNRSTEVLKGRNNVELAGALVLNAYGQFLPDLNAGAGVNYSAGKSLAVTTGPILVNANRSAYNYQLTITLNIFTGKYNYASLKAATLNRKSSELTLERARQQISLDVTQS